MWGHGCLSRCILATLVHCSHQQLKAWECYSFLQGQARIPWVLGTIGPTFPILPPMKTTSKDPTHLCLSPYLFWVVRLAEGTHVHR